ncbi:protein kinase domain-containing protein [Paludisphaera borealis]|uniref:Serine/threonine-protein kinase PknB n=1 Tax=Paludisphaera borealis TaxID=1387353 RepID=A0A1U7CP67_9BACT|nr:serine/threonine-protein kinase [Paludisphaera borealis]APW60727.1 Serine/threonine-protein kinase PknB [Paludisphaera borealis]
MSGEHRAASDDDELFDQWNLADDDPLDSLRWTEDPRQRSLRKPSKPSTEATREGTREAQPLDPESSDLVQDFAVDSVRIEDASMSAGAGSAGEPAVTCVYDPDAGFQIGGRSGPDVPGRRAPLPRPGDEVGGFQLVIELGRGAFARVFLAEEVNLGRRLVALKISKAEGDEPQILARLQHAHIVPVHSVHDDSATGLRLLCMPFLGGANLAQVLEESCGYANARATGKGLVEALDQLSQRFPTRAGESLSLSRGSIGRAPSRSRLASSRGGPRCDSPVSTTAMTAATPVSERPAHHRPSRRYLPIRHLMERIAGAEAPATAVADHDELLPSRRFLRGADSIRAAVWIVARLAEGLEHAHSRGLLHRDLKPSNVLIAADGTPMLLDFNLAVAIEPGQEAAAEELDKAMLGGTLPYMAPEHLDAFDPKGRTKVQEVDERSDLYSLGLILFEMIAGEPAFDPPPSNGPTLHTLRRMVEERRRSPAPSLKARRPDVPPSIDALVAQCLDPNPDRRHASAGDLAEDLRRFLDDLPMKHCPEPSLTERAGKWARRHPMLCGSTSIVAAAMVMVVLLGLAAVQAYEGMQGLHSRLRLRVFQHDVLECRFLLNTFGRDDALIRKGIALAAATLKNAQVAETDAADFEDRVSPEQAAAPWISRLGPLERDEVQRSIVELTMQLAHARVVLSSRHGVGQQLRTALENAVARLDQVEATTSRPPSVLFRQRSRYRAALGDAEGAVRDRARADAQPPTTSHEWTMLGSFLFVSGDPTAAEQALREAVARDVTSFWAWFNLGHCHFDQGRFLEAASDFTACVVARPEFAWAHFNRGLALARAGRPREAKDAFNAAVARDGDFAEAFVNRGLVELELDQAAEAEADLRKGMDRGRRDPAVLAALGDALVRQGKTVEAERLFGEWIGQAPRDLTLRVARGITRLRTDPDSAAADFATVLAVKPRHALAHYGMACVVRVTDRARAIAHLDQAIQADPGLIDAFEARALERARDGDRGALDDVDRLIKSPTANRLYNASCALAILGEATREPRFFGRAVAILESSFKAGFPPAHAVDDADLAPLRGRADYVALLARYRGDAGR